MDEQNQTQPTQIMSRFLHQFKKNMANLKVKSFYASHLCKKNCLQSNLNSNQDQCMNECDEWLKKFYDKKRQSNPQMAQQVLIQVQNKIQDLKKNQDLQFQKACAFAKLEINSYMNTLNTQIDEKIAKQTQKK